MKKRLLLSSLCMLFCFMTMAQERTITGTVTTKDGTPLVGASVTVVGHKTGETTGSDGKFSISVPANAKTLRVSYVGYQDQDISIAGESNISVSLQSTATNLNEVVVTGYGTQRKKDITGSVSVVNVSNMKQVPAGNAESLLQGQAAGVTVINSGVPGGGTAVRVRGITSLGNADPLYIVDGVESVNGLRDINPDDIESIQVLKDAGAAAIYGIQGSNGVIIVTTKKGHGKPTVTYDMYLGTQRPLSGNVFNLTDTKGYAQAIWDMETNSGITGTNRTGQFGQTGTSPTIPEYILPENGKSGDSLTNPSTYDINNNQITKANQTGTDWFHEIFKPAMIQNHTVTVSAGSDKSSYLFSMNYFNQQGTLINTYLKKYDVRANTQFNIKDHIRVGENADVIYRQTPGFGNQSEGNAVSFAYRMPPIIPVYDIMGNYAGTKSPHLSNSQNPVAIQQRTANNKNNSWSMIGNVFADVDFLRHFTAHTSFGGTVENYYGYSFTPTPYNDAEGNTNPNAFNEYSGYNSQWQWTNTLTYSNVFGLHSIKILGGLESKKTYERGFSAGRINYFSSDPNYLILNTGSPTGGVSNNGQPPYVNLSLYSQFGRLDYQYNDKYLLSATIRRDGASVFDANHRFGVFPSVSAGWRISQESFLKDVSFINDLKIRGGWGKLGSIKNIGATNAYTLYASGAGYSYYSINGDPDGATMGFYQSQYGNPATTWEQDIISNVGLDATIINNKLNLSVEYYKKKISGLLFQKQSQIGNFAGGASQPIINSGDIQNSGIDGSITYHGDVGSSGFHFDVTGTLTSYNSKIVSLPPGYKYQDYSSNGSTRIGAFTRAQPGEPIGEFFGYKVIGLFQDAADVTKSPKQPAAAPGRFKYADINGDGVIDDQDRTWIGNPNPKFTYGLNINASYKAFDFSVFFYGSQGNQDFNFVKYWTDFPQVFRGGISNDALTKSAILVNAAGQPTTSSDPTAHVSNPGATVPVLETASGFSNTSTVNSFYVENGSFLKLRSLILGYTLPVNPLKKVGINKLRIYIQGSNLFTITKYSGLDPELQQSNLSDNSNFGIDFGNYPANQKEYLFGINASF